MSSASTESAQFGDAPAITADAPTVAVDKDDDGWDLSEDDAYSDERLITGYPDRLYALFFARQLRRIRMPVVLVLCEGLMAVCIDSDLPFKTADLPDMVRKAAATPGCALLFYIDTQHNKSGFRVYTSGRVDEFAEYLPKTGKKANIKLSLNIQGGVMDMAVRHTNEAIDELHARLSRKSKFKVKR